VEESGSTGGAGLDPTEDFALCHLSSTCRQSKEIRADSHNREKGAMDSCPFVRVLVGNLVLRMPLAPCSSPTTSQQRGGGMALAVRGGGSGGGGVVQCGISMALAKPMMEWGGVHMS
jgi:hypothetical protein